MANLFPIFLKLEGRTVLVVGAGIIAEQKLGGLVSARAEIHVVAPEASVAIRELAHNRKLSWSQREFQSLDLTGVFLVIAATGNPAVNERIFREADARGVLCNAVDEPERCHFYYGSVVQRGDLQIAISTAGHSPALAQRIRKQLEQEFDNAYADWLNWLGRARVRLFGRKMDAERRRRILHRIARPESYARFRRTQSGVSQ